MFFLWVNYPELEEELKIYAQTTGTLEPKVEPVMHGQDILEITRIIRQIPISDPLLRYVANIVRCTRTDRGHEGSEVVPEFIRKYQQWGAGPRAGQYFILGAKARAFMNGHTHVATEDIRAVARPVLAHRIIVNFAAQADGVSSLDLVDRILETVEP